MDRLGGRQWDCCLSQSNDGSSPRPDYVRTAGCVIARQRPGTAKGFIFLSLEDETSIANMIVTPDLYERDRLVVTRSKFLLVEGTFQNQDGVIPRQGGPFIGAFQQRPRPALP